MEKNKKISALLAFHVLFWIFVFSGGRWTIEVNGAQGTLYANEMYLFQGDFPEQNPMKAPQVSFSLFFQYIFILWRKCSL